MTGDEDVGQADVKLDAEEAEDAEDDEDELGFEGKRAGVLETELRIETWDAATGSEALDWLLVTCALRRGFSARSGTSSVRAETRV